MTDLSAFPVVKRWPAEHPDRLQLYSLNTPNGVKVSISIYTLDLGKSEESTLATLQRHKKMVD